MKCQLSSLQAARPNIPGGPLLPQPPSAPSSAPRSAPPAPRAGVDGASLPPPITVVGKLIVKGKFDFKSVSGKGRGERGGRGG